MSYLSHEGGGGKKGLFWRHMIYECSLMPKHEFPFSGERGSGNHQNQQEVLSEEGCK